MAANWDPNVEFRKACIAIVDGLTNDEFGVIFKADKNLQRGSELGRGPLHPPHVDGERFVRALITYTGPKEIELKDRNLVPIPVKPRDEFHAQAWHWLNCWRFDEMGKEEAEYKCDYRMQKVVATKKFRLVLAYYGPNKDPIVEHEKGHDGVSQAVRESREIVEERNRMIAEGDETSVLEYLKASGRLKDLDLEE